MKAVTAAPMSLVGRLLAKRSVRPSGSGVPVLSETGPGAAAGRAGSDQPPAQPNVAATVNSHLIRQATEQSSQQAGSGAKRAAPTEQPESEQATARTFQAMDYAWLRQAFCRTDPAEIGLCDRRIVAQEYSRLNDQFEKTSEAAQTLLDHCISLKAELHATESKLSMKRYKHERYAKRRQLTHPEPVQDLSIPDRRVVELTVAVEELESRDAMHQQRQQELRAERFRMQEQLDLLSAGLAQQQAKTSEREEAVKQLELRLSEAQREINNFKTATAVFQQLKVDVQSSSKPTSTQLKAHYVLLRGALLNLYGGVPDPTNPDPNGWQEAVPYLVDALLAEHPQLADRILKPAREAAVQQVLEALRKHWAKEALNIFVHCKLTENRYQILINLLTKAVIDGLRVPIEIPFGGKMVKVFVTREDVVKELQTNADQRGFKEGYLHATADLKKQLLHRLAILKELGVLFHRPGRPGRLLVKISADASSVRKASSVSAAATASVI